MTNETNNYPEFNGWQAVKIGSQVGWVSGNYSKVI